MKYFSLPLGIAILTCLLFLSTLSCQKELKAPNGLSFSYIRDYKNWPLISLNYRQDLEELHMILGNRTALENYIHGTPQNGKSFTDGTVLVRLIFAARPNPSFPQSLEPVGLQRLDYMLKDVERFKETEGWGYANFIYDAKNQSFKPFGKDASFAQECCNCHRLAKSRDCVFTSYTTKATK